MSDADNASNGRVYDPNADHAFPDKRLNEVLETVESDA